jgi:mycofactocin glycosyltransferase
MTSPVISVIVPSYQSQDTIRYCLNSLLDQEIEQQFEIVVVDSSTDATPDIIRKEYPGVKLFHLPKKTDPAAARNLGAWSSTGEVLAFIDSDCTAGKDWLERLYEELSGEFSAVGGSVMNSTEDNPVCWAGYFCEFREFLPVGEKREVENITLGNAAYKKNTFFGAGAFPEGCFPQEDQVFHKKYKMFGNRIIYDPTNPVWHRHRTSEADFCKHQMLIGRANAAVVNRLDLPGVFLVRSPILSKIAMPAVAVLRFARTILACWKLENFLVLRKPRVFWLCALGTFWWAKGFQKGAEGIYYTGSSGHALFNG